jgi:Ca2+-binding EF-hand superfamily protein
MSEEYDSEYTDESEEELASSSKKIAVEDDESYEEDDYTDEEEDEYTIEKRNQLTQLFKLFDEDGNGTINIDELEKAMKGYGKAVTRDEVLRILKEADSNNDGVIDFREFSILMGPTFEQYYKTYHNPSVVMRQLENAFALFDFKNDGTITTKEFRQLFDQMATSTETGYVGADVDPKEVDKIVKMADRDDNGTVSLVDFKKLLKDNDGAVLKQIMYMMRPSPIDYLKSFENMPESFRKSILHRKLVDGSQSPSQYLKPMLSESGLRALDLRLDALSGQLLPRNLKHHHTFRLSLVQARGIPMPETTEDILARKIYICLHDGIGFVSNVYEIPAIWHPTRADEWQFNLNHANNKIAICTLTNNIDLKLIFEFVIVTKKQSGSSNEITCGNAVVDLMRENIDTVERVFIKFVTGGTILNPVQIASTDIKSKRKDIAGKLAQAIRGKPKPELETRIRRILTPVDERVSYLTCPLDFIASTETITVLSIYRAILAHKLLIEKSSGDTDHKVREVIDPALVWFPKMLDDPDLWEIFMKRWHAVHKSLLKKNASQSDVQQQFLSLVREIYPALHSMYKPHYQYSGSKNIRAEFYRTFCENTLDNLCKNDSVYKPFDVRDAVFNFDMFR